MKIKLRENKEVAKKGIVNGKKSHGNLKDNSGMKAVIFSFQEIQATPYETISCENMVL
ncbi:hypothetical protein BH20BAC1_BH20BAC1_23860 [soil metagenome]